MSTPADTLSLALDRALALSELMQHGANYADLAPLLDGPNPIGTAAILLSEELCRARSALEAVCNGLNRPGIPGDSRL